VTDRSGIFIHDPRCLADAPGRRCLSDPAT